MELNDFQGNTDRATCQMILQRILQLLLVRDEASVAMLLRNTSCRHFAAVAGTSLSSMWSLPIQLILLLTLLHTSCQFTVSKLCCSACMPPFFCLWYNSSSLDFSSAARGSSTCIFDAQILSPTNRTLGTSY